MSNAKEPIEAEFVTSKDASGEPSKKGALSEVLDGLDEISEVLPEHTREGISNMTSKARRAQKGARKTLVGIATLAQVLADKLSTVKLPPPKAR